MRHGRFQQWQLSRHANYDLAIDEGLDENCSRCHSGNGFLVWGEEFNYADQELWADPAETISLVTWTADQIHPQTCVTCHDPHAVGTSSNVGTDATTRIFDNTPVLAAGWQAFGVGNGAICMTCHNTRRGLRNDSTFVATKSSGDTARAPHGGAQGDVVMGQNAYFVQVGIRGSHSFVTDTCVNCHMVQTPPPDLLSYNSGGTNHTFFASDDICSNCHGEAFTADGVQGAFEASLNEVQGLMEAAILQVIDDAINDTPGNTVDLNGLAIITDVSEIQDIVFGEFRGRQSTTVTLTDTTVVGPVRLSDVDVLDSSSTVLGELYEFADDTVPKAGWNWNLVSNDGSKGIHNPNFALGVLDSARDALNALAGAP
jgi:formate-dependent nitrite reductase cytochrome c552 subunit